MTGSVEHPSAASITVRAADWRTDGAAIKAIRTHVFIDEQHVPADLEWDGLDATAFHVLAEDRAAGAVATGRLLSDGHIGRMAVERFFRGQGVGRAVLLRLISEAEARGIFKLALNAQTTAIGFYRRFGFNAVGEEFLDAGIPHFRMERIATALSA